MRIVMLVSVIMLSVSIYAKDISLFGSMAPANSQVHLALSLKPSSSKDFSMVWKQEVIEIKQPVLATTSDGLVFQSEVWIGEESEKIELLVGKNVASQRGRFSCVSQQKIECLSISASEIFKPLASSNQKSDFLVLRQIEYDWNSKIVQAFKLEVRSYDNVQAIGPSY